MFPRSLSGDDGLVAASECRAVLLEYGIDDVDVEFRESIVRQLVFISSDKERKKKRKGKGYFSGNREKFELTRQGERGFADQGWCA